MRILENLKITGLIDRAPWREAVTYRDMWPHEYVLSRKDGQHELVELVVARFRAGEGVAALSPIRRLPSTGNRKPYSMAARPSTIQHSWPDPPPHPYSFVLTASRVLDSGPVTHQDLGEDGSGIRKDSPLPCLRPRRASCAPQKNFGSRPCPFAFYTQVQWLTPGRVSRPVRVHGQGGVPPRRAFSCGGTGAFQSSYQPSRLTKPTGSAARPPILS